MPLNEETKQYNLNKKECLTQNPVEYERNQ